MRLRLRLRRVAALEAAGAAGVRRLCSSSAGAPAQLV
eukprot:COSAG02_NODE_62724_length_265_cov_0.620482_1_plen_36_part_01